MTYNRILGLDIIRASAIILVLIGHLGQVGFLGNSYFCYLMGYYGVELFFVLSGFLIGQILIKEFSKGITWKSIRQFWIKRWLRTLPLYYLVLILRIIIDHDMHSLHFIFLQCFFISNSTGTFKVGNNHLQHFCKITKIRSPSKFMF